MNEPIKKQQFFLADYLSFSTIKLRVMVMYQNWVFDFLENYAYESLEQL
jgi:hypothetical protein